MARRSINRTELSANAHFDWRKSPVNKTSLPESPITRGAEEALYAEIELLAGGFVEKEEKMKRAILKDLHLAQHGTETQVADAKSRLAKVGINKNWPNEILAVVEGRLKEAGLQVKPVDYQRDPRYAAFHKLFDNGKEKSLQ